MVRNKDNSEERPDDKKATSLPACEVVGLPGDAQTLSSQLCSFTQNNYQLVRKALTDI